MRKRRATRDCAQLGAGSSATTIAVRRNGKASETEAPTQSSRRRAAKRHTRRGFNANRFAQSVGKAIRETRLAAGLSLAAVERQMNCSISWLARLEEGTEHLQAAQLEPLAAILKTTARDLVSLTFDIYERNERR
jgi:ribosome-binding protein aMBF1 (putative translation factor)